MTPGIRLSPVYDSGPVEVLHGVQQLGRVEPGHRQLERAHLGQMSQQLAPLGVRQHKVCTATGQGNSRTDSPQRRKW